MKKIAALFLLLLILAIIPLAVFLDFTPVKSTAGSNISPQNTKALTDCEAAVQIAASYFSEDLEEEAIKAICLVALNNCRADSNYSKNGMSNNAMKEKWKDSYNINLKKLQNAVENVKQVKITCNKKEVFIPIFPSSNGATATSDEYPYLKSVASPWDKGASSYAAGNICQGVSVLGVNHIIKQGENYKSALLWYLPDFEITEE